MVGPHTARRPDNTKQEPYALMSTSKAAGKAALRDSTDLRAERPPTVTGWDPFEVWRTRVLAPRLADQALAKHAEPAAAKPRLVRSA
jgi:hypothetical protein